MEDLIKLDFVDLAIAAVFMAGAIGLSAWEKLGLELNLVTATGRTILQLLVLGYVLDFIFALDNVWGVLAILAVIITITAIVARNRISPKIPLVLGLVLIVTGSIVTAHYDIQLGAWPAKFSDRVAWLAWTDRSRVGFLRLINHIGFFPLLYIIVDTF